MTAFDIRMFLTGYVLSIILCIILMTSLWWQNRKLYPEIILWLADYLLQFAGVLLITMRGIMPDFFTIVIANVFVILGNIILYIGLGRHVGKESRQLHNYVMLSVFTLVHLYLTYVHPDFNLRVVNISIAYIYICAQCSWLMLRRAEANLRPITRVTGIFFAVFCLFCIIQITVNLTIPKINNLLLSGFLGIFAILTYQIAFIALSIALFLMVSRRLSISLENELFQRKRAEEKLAHLVLQNELILNSAAEGILGLDLQGKHTFVNSAAAKMLGYEVEELIGSPSHSIWHHTKPDGSPYPQEECNIRATYLEGKVHRVSTEVFWRKDGTSFPVEYACTPICEQGRTTGAVVTFVDITERKRTENYREMGNKILQILSKSGSLHDSIQSVLTVLKTRTGFDAVGIRLRKGDDFPYFAQNGFSDDFLLTENTLTERDVDGGLCRNKDGKVSLQCTCGLVISGKTDPTNPLFTKGGSFWTNDSFQLLDLTSDQDPRLRPRNKCIHQGYTSFTLVPIRNKDSIVGLIQLNDRRKNVFSLTAIEQFESIAANIGEAIMRMDAEEALRKSEERFKQLAEVFPETIFEANMEGNVTYTNEYGLNQFGFTIEDIAKGVNIFDMISPPDRKLAQERIQSRIQGTNERYLEYQAMKKDGSTFYALALSVPIMVEGIPAGIRGFVMDITERKRAEKALKQNESFLNTLLNSIPIPVFYKDKDGRYTGFNRAFETFFGTTKEQLVGKTVFDINPPELAKIYHAKDNELFESGIEQHYESQVKNMLGVTRDVIFNKAVFTDSQGTINGLIGAIMDITERKQAEEALRESEARISAITNFANDAIAMMDNNGNISYWNPAAEHVLGYTSAEAIGRNLHELIAPERFLAAHLAAFPEFQKMGRGNAIGKTLELAARRKDGREIEVTLSLSAVKIEGAWHSVGIMQDITEHKQAENALRESEERYHFIADHTADHIWTMDLSMRFIYSSPAVFKILGYTVEELMTKTFDQYLTPESLMMMKKVLMEEIETDNEPSVDPNRMRTLQSEHYHKNGHLVWMESTLTFIRDAEMKPVGILGVSRDITGRKKTEVQIQHLATHDLLTDLPSLRLANDRLSSALNMARRHKKAVALMFIDLDGFKAVNDTLGHDAGDYVLKQVAQRMLSCVRETDTVARIGGDEFLIIATEINAPQNAAQIAEKVIQSLSKPIVFKKLQAIVGASIGIALFPDHGEDIDQLIKQADKAMYSVKNAGKNDFRFADTATK
jgi:diguanylate cyclase (GGDEF)-like protein/PAS domain S-box-containing protein